MTTGTVYDHIHDNNMRTLVLVLAFPVLFVALFYLASFVTLYCLAINQDGIADMEQIFMEINQFSAIHIPIIIGGAFVWSFISWFFGKDMMLSLGGAHEELLPTTSQNKQIYRLVENTALMAGLPMPKVYLINDDGLNAFATGRDPNHSAVALTKGIIQKLEPLELQGVIAHELSHIGNRDIRLNMFIITGIGVLGLVGEFILRSFTSSHRSQRSSKSGGGNVLFLVLGGVLIVFNILIAPLIQLAISRKREYAADATAALITRNPMALAKALEKISENPVLKKAGSSKNMAIACICSPFVESLTSTHPPIETRIKRLNEMAGRYYVNQKKEELK